VRTLRSLESIALLTPIAPVQPRDDLLSADPPEPVCGGLLAACNHQANERRPY
jgi:hypothetical protein